MFKKLFTYWFTLKLWQQVLVGLFAGVFFGGFFGHTAVTFKPIGNLFINAIHMMITPIIFTAITCAVISMQDTKKMRRIGSKAVLLYAICMCLAATIGLLVANFLHPGSGLHLALNSSKLLKSDNVQTVSDLIVNIIPDNPVASFATGNVLQIVVFSIILGLSINMAGKKSALIIDLFRSMAHVVFKLAYIVMSMAPYGIFALIAWVTGQFGFQALLPLLKLVLTMYSGFILNMLIVYFLGIFFVARLNPVKFFKGIIDALLFAFSTTSSAATLPVTVRCAEENLGVSKEIAEFLLPLGTSLNLNGLAVYLSVVTVFTAELYGIHLSFANYLTVITAIVLTGMGAGGVPGSGIIVMSAVLSSVGLPIGTVALVASVDRILDMGSTTTNVTGDAFTTLIVAKNEKELNLDIYNKK